MQLVFATHNNNKLKEIQALMPAHITLKSLTDIGCTEDNALIKARYVKNKYGYDCFADDTGLEVNALNGEPGVYSARYAGEQKSSSDNIDKLLAKLKNSKDRSAQFKTVIALIINDTEHIFTGICKGQIIKDKKGNGGFGYDPVFQPDGYDKTFAEMSLELKGKISHRGLAVQKLLNFLQK